MTGFIVIGGAVIVTAVFLVLPACWLTSNRHERWAERYWADLDSPVTDDPQEWTGPLHAGSTGAEKRMRRFHAEHGLLLWNRASERTRKTAAALDKARPRRGRRPVTVVRAAALEPLPVAAASEHVAPLPPVVEPAEVLDDEPQFTYSGDNTIWANMRNDLFAMLDADGKS